MPPALFLMDGVLMKIKHSFLFTFVLGLVWTGYLFAFITGPEPGVNGVFGPTQTCATSGCHSSFPLNSGPGSVNVTGLPANGWTAGQTYPLTVTIQQTGRQIFGFQLSAVADATTTQAGLLVTPGTGVQLICGFKGSTTIISNCSTPPASTIQYAEHRDASVPRSTYTVSWTAPASATVGSVRFNVAGNAANGDRDPGGDFIYTKAFVIAPASAPPPPSVSTFYFPQIADGGDPTAFWRTTVFITNPAAIGTTPASGAITLWTSAGAAFNTGFVDAAGAPVGSGNTVPFSLSGGETRKFSSTSAGPLAVGFATVTADADVRGTAVFSEILGGTLFAEAGVPSATAVLKQAIFVDTTAGFDTGVAFANPNSTPANITFSLFNAAGAPVGAPLVRTLATNQHNALFVSQLFQGAPPFTGTMQIISDVPVAVVALRFASSGIFTTLPPVPLGQ
jgi:hypothetical protein